MGAIVQLNPVNVWVQTIEGRWGKGLDAVFDTGQLLLDAKRALPHGQFEDMIHGQLPFTPATARKLMTIAAKTILANRSVRNVLPVSWTIVYELCHVADDELERWFAQGKIHPTLTTQEVYALRPTRRAYKPRGAHYPSQLAQPPALPAPQAEPSVWAEKILDTLQTLVRQFDGIDLAAVHHGMKYQQVRDLAALIRTTRNWFDVLEVSKGEKPK